VFAWDPKASAWEKEPVATSDRMSSAKAKLWQHTITLLAAPGSERAKAWTKGNAALPAGKYLVKVYVDSSDRGAKDWRSKPGASEYVGQIEVQAQWRTGYGAMTVADAGRAKP
jgi:hypothetical protein